MILPTSNSVRAGIVGAGTYGVSNEVNAFRLGNEGPNFLLSYWWANDLLSTSAVTIGRPGIAATQWGSSTTDFIYYNGNTIATGSRTGKNTTAISNTVGSTFPASNNEYFDGQIGEILIFNKVLALGERQEVEGYFAWKWDTRSTLVSTHPYINRPPVIGD
jgi:hypothetical protein